MQKRDYPFSKALRPKANALEQYYGEISSLGRAGLLKILDRGREFSESVANRLANGGGAIFPHTYLTKCGYQIAAVVHGILDCGLSRVILLGTAHAFPGELFDARVKELNGDDISKEASWGLLDSEHVKKEFSLDLFKTLFQLEVERRGKEAPHIAEKYPCLTNRKPSALPGIEKLREQLDECAIVGTDDYCHHGIAYGVKKEDAFSMDKQGLSFAREQIEEGFHYLQKNDYTSYFEHWMNPHAIGDPPDVTTVIHYLIGESASPKILDLKLVDVSPLFEDDPEPSWVAATLALL